MIQCCQPAAAIAVSYIKQVYNGFKHLNESTFFITHWLTEYSKGWCLAHASWS